MTAEQTPRSMRYNIVLVGCRNAGKSSLINALTNQDVSIVSSEAGTTTDVVTKSYELLPLGPVTFFDTAGLDDASSLGEARIKATQKALYKADLVLLVIGEIGISDFDKTIINNLIKMNIPFVVVLNKADIIRDLSNDKAFLEQNHIVYSITSTVSNLGVDDLKSIIVRELPAEKKESLSLLKDLVGANDCVVLVTPIDSSAPKNRLILPQVQVLREILDLRAFAVVTQVDELNNAMLSLKNKPKIVITDSQVVDKVNKSISTDIDLTTFSILFARFKGDLKTMVEGARKIDLLEDCDTILIAEACSHHAQDDDIAKVKIPNLLKKYTQKCLNFEFCTGCDFPENLEKYKLVVHCGACMINRAEMNHRLDECVRRGVPITNYGVAISKAQGILDRVIKPFGL